MEQAWTVRRRRDAERVQCPLCHDALAEDASLTECVECSAVHHAECWTDLGRCAACTGARGRAPAIVVAPTADPDVTRAPKVCTTEGCRRLEHGAHPDPHLCHVHGAQAFGFGVVWATGILAVVLEVAAVIGALDPTDRRFPMSWGLACFYYGLPIVMLAWGLLTLAWGLLAERTVPNEPAPRSPRRRASKA